MASLSMFHLGAGEDQMETMKRTARWVAQVRNHKSAGICIYNYGCICMCVRVCAFIITFSQLPAAFVCAPKRAHTKQKVEGKVGNTATWRLLRSVSPSLWRSEVLQVRQKRLIDGRQSKAVTKAEMWTWNVHTANTKTNSNAYKAKQQKKQKQQLKRKSLRL